MLKNLLLSSTLFLVSFSACNNDKGNQEAADVEGIASNFQECRLLFAANKPTAKKSFTVIRSSTRENWISTNRIFELPFGDGTTANPKYVVKFADFKRVNASTNWTSQEIALSNLVVVARGLNMVLPDGKFGLSFMLVSEFPIVNGVKSEQASRVFNYSCEKDGTIQTSNDTGEVSSSGTSSFGNTLAINAAGPSIAVSTGSNPGFNGKEIRINLDQCTTMLVTKADNINETKVEFTTESQCAGGKSPRVFSTGSNSIIMRLQ